MCGKVRRRGTNGVSTDGVTANFMLYIYIYTFWVLPLTYLTIIFPKVPGRTFFPNLSKLITFAAAPLMLTPFVRNQVDVKTASCAKTLITANLPTKIIPTKTACRKLSRKFAMGMRIPPLKLRVFFSQTL